mmetsp:Transcript_4323/g.11172  ORF Transcript_4323/g.11172 Transcript_4323/m.11172 type:complete len:263 (-) Transcript_4323:111-899(-)
MEVIEGCTHVEGHVQAFCQELSDFYRDITAVIRRELVIVIPPDVDLVFEGALKAVEQQEIPPLFHLGESRGSRRSHSTQLDDVGMLQGGQKLGLDDQIRRAGDVPTGIADRVDRQEFHRVPAVLRGFPKDVLRHEGAVLLLERTRDLLRVLGVLEVLDDLDGLDLVDVVEPSRAEKVAENDLRPLETGDAFFERRIDDPGVFAHVLGRSARGLPGFAADVLDFGPVHVIAGAHCVEKVMEMAVPVVIAAAAAAKAAIAVALL